MAGTAPVRQRRGKALLVVLCIVLAVAVAVAIFWLNQSATASSDGPPSPVATVAAPMSPTTTATATPTTAAAPSSAELSDLETALTSTEPAKVLSYLPIGAGETVDASFPARLAAMNLTLDAKSLVEQIPGVWMVQARDGSGQVWDVGLVRKADHLVIFSAEKAGAP
ncbi:hypothetical protein IV500_05690 [Paeniglutamicibacter antarcticus]|uniref:Uncharacterized protein n=1 Tax=Arthrobacter terrae TaxID=2935737 RepID=A0A931G754_9MICC|nr:hypothetical protein [Arthrobacter terrae]MBG0738914.1 hypothetical protein [Arthrobacter terrae]